MEKHTDNQARKIPSKTFVEYADKKHEVKLKLGFFDGFY